MLEDFVRENAIYGWVIIASVISFTGGYIIAWIQHSDRFGD